jgi:hypothetical protein
MRMRLEAIDQLKEVVRFLIFSFWVKIGGRESDFG